MARECRRTGRTYTRAQVARRLRMTETEVEALAGLVADQLSPLPRLDRVDAEEQRREVGRVIGVDAARFEREATALAARLAASEDHRQQALSLEGPAPEAAGDESVWAEAEDFRARVTRWETAARQLCREYGFPAPEPSLR